MGVGGSRTATRSPEGLVCGGGDHVRRLEGVRYHACRHQSAATSTENLSAHALSTAWQHPYKSMQYTTPGRQHVLRRTGKWGA